MKGQPKKSKIFDNYSEAKGFMSAMNENPDCESYGIDHEFQMAQFNESPNGPTGHGDICYSDADPGL
jgi:hypothetical protein